MEAAVKKDSNTAEKNPNQNWNKKRFCVMTTFLKN